MHTIFPASRVISIFSVAQREATKVPAAGDRLAFIRGIGSSTLCEHTTTAREGTRVTAHHATRVTAHAGTRVTAHHATRVTA